MITSSEIEKEALRLLLKQPLAGRFALSFLDMRKFILDGKALVTAISDYEASTGQRLAVRPEGVTVISGNIPLILYDQSITYLPRLNFTIAHELGHIVLCHTTDKRREQREADKFAAELLMPSAVLAFLKCHLGDKLTPDEMTKYFPASRMACQKRLGGFRFDTYSPTHDGITLVKRLFSNDTSPCDPYESDYFSSII